MDSTSPQSHQNAATAPARNRLTRLSVLETPPNCRSFYDDLYQTQLSGCSAFPESRLQCLPHPYSPLRVNTFLRISRNRVQAINPHLNKSFEMKILMYSTRIAFVRSNLANLSEIFFKSE